MKKNTYYLLLLLIFLLPSCKSLKTHRLYFPKMETQYKIVPLTPMINTAQLPRNYNYNRKKSNFFDKPAKKLALPFDTGSEYNGDFMDLSTRYFYYVFNDLNKRGSETSKAKEMVQGTNGEMYLTVKSYKRPRNPLLSLLLTPSWATLYPMLMGIPVGHRKAKLDLQIDIKNTNGEIVKSYNAKCKHTSMMACYWGYNKEDAPSAAHLKALNKGLKKIAKQIDKDAALINGKLFTPGAYAIEVSDAKYLLTMGKAIMENKHYNEALYILYKANQLNPTIMDEVGVPSSFYIALCLNKLNSYSESIVWLQKAETQSKSVVVSNGLYKSISETNNTNASQTNQKAYLSSESIALFDSKQLKAKEETEMRAQAYDILKKADDLYTAKKYRLAIEKYEKALQYIPATKDAAQAYYQYGDCYFNSSEGKEDDYKAIAYIKKSYLLDPTYSAMVPVTLFLMYKSMSLYDDANEWYDKTLSHSGCNDKLRTLMVDWKNEMLVSKVQIDAGKKLIEQPVNVEISNLGNAINSKNDEYFPSITADESMFIFTSTRAGGTGGIMSSGNYDEDLWYCEKLNDNTWSSPKNMGKPVNIENNNGVASFTGDGQYVVCTRCNESDGFGSCDNYFSYLTGKVWSTPKNMGALVNSDEWDSQACISVDGKKMIFSSKRKGGFGDADLWISEVDNNGTWGIPKNLGSKINTSGSESAPFLHPDGKTLYFTSNNISPRIGGQDIYKSMLQADGSWSLPENLGYPINSEGNDKNFVLAPSGLIGYLASDRTGGFGGDDIYKIEFPQEKRTALVTVVGFVYDDETKQPISANVQIEDVEKNEIVGAYKSNESTGKFVVVLTPGRNYSLSVNKKDYLFYSENFNVADTNDFIEVKKEVYLQKLVIGKKIVLNNIFFETGKSELKAESQIEINRLIELMNENPEMKVEISGHTDNVGDEQLNMQLSQARADVVVNALVAKGISKTRMISKGYGKTTPVASNETPEGRALNRRTEFKIISK